MKMTVFHVFFLVLVMWAVHSHGRAYETESIIYNNTQLPYKENMNAGTVINSKLKDFDYFYLVLQWPNTFCNLNGITCRPPPVSNDFIVHGLWPQRNSIPRIDCEGVLNTAPFDFLKLQGYENGKLVEYLEEFWPNLKIGPNRAFWRKEFKKHGSCFFPTEVGYFASTRYMKSQIPELTRYPENQVIKPGTPYLFNDLHQRIIRATGVVPILQCVRGYNQLYQIFFCASKANLLVSCDGYPFTKVNKGCPETVILPLPGP